MTESTALHNRTTAALHDRSTAALVFAAAPLPIASPQNHNLQILALKLLSLLQFQEWGSGKIMSV